MSIIRTTVLSKTYRSGLFRRAETNAVKHVTLSVNAREIFGLLGPNGAGKTTFVKLLLSLVYPTGGAGYIFEYPLGALAIREKTGYLPEGHRFPPFLTGLETLYFLGGMHGLRGKVLRDKVLDLLRLVGLSSVANAKIKKYSKGMLQRLGLAQAMLHNPELLILDEPTDGVDPIGRKEIRDILLDLRSRGATIFLNSHLLSEVETICDRVAILNKGELIKIASVKDLTTDQALYEIHTEHPVPQETLSKLHAAGRVYQKDSCVLILSTPDGEQLNQVIDTLRQVGVLLRSVTSLKSTFEESFIQLLREKDQP